MLRQLQDTRCRRVQAFWSSPGPCWSSRQPSSRPSRSWSGTTSQPMPSTSRTSSALTRSSRRTWRSIQVSGSSLGWQVWALKEQLELSCGKSRFQVTKSLTGKKVKSVNCVNYNWSLIRLGTLSHVAKYFTKCLNEAFLLLQCNLEKQVGLFSFNLSLTWNWVDWNTPEWKSTCSSVSFNSILD